MFRALLALASLAALPYSAEAGGFGGAVRIRSAGCFGAQRVVVRQQYAPQVVVRQQYVPQVIQQQYVPQQVIQQQYVPQQVILQQGCFGSSAYGSSLGCGVNQQAIYGQGFGLNNVYGSGFGLNGLGVRNRFIGGRLSSGLGLSLGFGF